MEESCTAKILKVTGKAPEENYLIFSRKEWRVWALLSGIHKAGYFLSSPERRCFCPAYDMGRATVIDVDIPWRAAIHHPDSI